LTIVLFRLTNLGTKDWVLADRPLHVTFEPAALALVKYKQSQWSETNKHSTTVYYWDTIQVRSI